MSDQQLDSHLKSLMMALEAIGADHEELYDTDVREQMFTAVHQGFLKPQAGYVLPDRFGMFSQDADLHIKAALSRYLEAANQRAQDLGLTQPTDRLAAFQNAEVCTDDQQYPDDFFGWAESIE